MIKLKSLNKKGFAHLHLIVIAVVIIISIGAIGSYVVYRSKAESGVSKSVTSEQETDSINRLSSASTIRQKVVKAAKNEYSNSFVITMNIKTALKDYKKPVKKYADYACYGKKVDDWSTAFVSWVYKQGSGNSKYKSCNAKTLYNQAVKLKTVKTISKDSLPKAGDILINKAKTRAAITLSSYSYEAGKDSDVSYPAGYGTNYYYVQKVEGPPNSRVLNLGLTETANDLNPLPFRYYVSID